MKRASKQIIRYETPKTNVSRSQVSTQASSSSTGGAIESCNQESFIRVSVFDKDRWYNQPDQVETLKNNNNMLYFDMKPYFKRDLDPYKNDATDGWYNGTYPIFHHDFESDVLLITLKYYPANYVYTPTGQGLIFNVQEYIPNTDSLEIFKNGRRLSKSEYYENTSTTINFYEFVQPFDEINIQYKTATLKSRIHYDIINSNIIRFRGRSIFDKFEITDMTAWGYRVYKESQHPIKLIDKKAKVVAKTIQYWHPAHDHHTVESIKNVDLKKPEDIAYYSYTPESISTEEEAAQSGFLVWGKERVGTIWLDTSNLVYKRYHDALSMNDCEERMRYWGQLADFGKADIYEWVRSDVPPDEWDELAIDEEKDLEIIETSRKSGRVWYPFFENENEIGETASYKLLVQQNEKFDVIVDGTQSDNDENEYTFTTNFKNYADLRSTLNVYVNGFIIAEDITLTETNKFTVSGLKEADVVHIVRLPVTNEDTIQDLLDDGTLIQDYRYTINTYNDEIGDELTEYYFWVRNKITKPAIKDKTMTPLFIERSLITPAAPFCFFQNPIAPKIIHYEDDVIELPWRMINLNVHGLRGLVDADRRYVLRFTRDFTLRDSMCTNPIDTALYEPLNPPNLEKPPGPGEPPPGTEAMDIYLEKQSFTSNKGKTDFTTSFSCPVGNMVVYLNGVKLTSSHYTQTATNAFELNTPTASNSDIVEAQSWIESTGEFDIGRQSEEIITYFGNKNFFTEKQYPNGHMKVYLNGIKLSDAEYEQTSTTAFVLTDSIETDGDRIEVETWTSKDAYEIVYFSLDYNNQQDIRSFYFGADYLNVYMNGGNLVQGINYEKIAAGFELTQSVPSIKDVLTAETLVMYIKDYSDLPIFPSSVEESGVTSAPTLKMAPGSVKIQANAVVPPSVASSFCFPLELKNLHEEWKVIRQEQQFIIDKYLWDNITESIIGRKIHDKNATVPSYDREIYDVIYDTETRFGLGNDQAFTHGERALETILYYLKDKNNDFKPTNIDEFFRQYSFDTEENIIESMDTIHSLFPYYHVNRMFFSVLHDALSFKHEYPDIIKTSWIALHSILLLDDQGRFDD